MPDDGRINVNDRRPLPIGVVAQDLLEQVATLLGVAVCYCMLKVLVQGGIAANLETKDCEFVTLLAFLAFSRCWCFWWPQAHRSFTETTQSLLADYFSWPYNKTLFYSSKLLFAMFSVVLAVMRLASQDFGKKEGANMESQDFVLNVFDGLALAEALLFLFALILSLFPKKRNAVGLADVPKVNPEDDPPKGLRDDRRNGPENVSGGGHEDRPIGEHKDGPEVDLEKGQGGVPGNGSVGRPANQSNDFNSKGKEEVYREIPLRQRRREIPKSGDGEDGSDEDGPGGEPGDAENAENARTSLGIIINTSKAMEGAELDKLQRDLALPAFAIGLLHKHDTITPEAATICAVHLQSVRSHLNDNCTTPFRESLTQVLSEDDRKSFVPCLVLDMHWYKINPVAKMLRVPMLVLRTGSAASLNGFIALLALYRKGILPSKAEWELELAVEELPPMRVRDMIAVGNDTEQLLNFVVLDAENARTSLGIILNTSKTMEGDELDKLQRDLALPTFAIGPLHKHDTISRPLHKHDTITLEVATTNTTPNSCTLKLLEQKRDQDRLCMEWLDLHTPKSVLYISFGSLASMDSKDFTEMVWGLADSGQPFLWVVRSGSVDSVVHVELALPDGFRNATHGIGRIVEWAPQRDILAHRAIGGFWTHCGWNSTVESIAEGIPMICTPFFSDQMGNTRYVSDVWKVGLELRTPLERGKVERSVRRLMTTEDGDEMRARAGDLQVILSECIQKEGCSYKAIDDLVGLLLSLSLSHSSE